MEYMYLYCLQGNLDGISTYIYTQPSINKSVIAVSIYIAHNANIK